MDFVFRSNFLKHIEVSEHQNIHILSGIICRSEYEITFNIRHLQDFKIVYYQLFELWVLVDIARGFKRDQLLLTDPVNRDLLAFRLKSHYDEPNGIHHIPTRTAKVDFIFAFFNIREMAMVLALSAPDLTKLFRPDRFKIHQLHVLKKVQVVFNLLKLTL